MVPLVGKLAHAFGHDECFRIALHAFFGFTAPEIFDACLPLVGEFFMSRSSPDLGFVFEIFGFDLELSLARVYSRGI